MKKKSITLDYSDYLDMVERMDLMKKSLAETNSVFCLVHDPWKWEYNIRAKPECIDLFIEATTVKQFKKIKKELNK